MKLVVYVIEGCAEEWVLVALCLPSEFSFFFYEEQSFLADAEGSLQDGALGARCVEGLRDGLAHFFAALVNLCWAEQLVVGSNVDQLAV